MASCLEHSEVTGLSPEVPAGPVLSSMTPSSPEGCAEPDSADPAGTALLSRLVRRLRPHPKGWQLPLHTFASRHLLCRSVESHRISSFHATLLRSTSRLSHQHLPVVRVACWRGRCCFLATLGGQGPPCGLWAPQPRLSAIASGSTLPSGCMAV